MSDPEKTGAYHQEAAITTVDFSAGPLPQRVGRYRVERVLGQGGFGLVYLAHDDQLQRLVAIKVPHARHISHSRDAEVYLTEARTIANLDHPHIVPVFDVGNNEEYPCFIVSKYVDGTDLAARLKKSRLAIHEAVGLISTIAEALHHAHKNGLVHRDIKPSNILLDHSGKPYIGDFGLALRERDVGFGPRFAGTPAYMSPEQARGEGHRVDGRSDIFSLGVVFYELLTGVRPFRAESSELLLEKIIDHDVRPPRQLDDHIPRELERICLKALSKRASERYSVARDMAEDLQHFLASASVEVRSTLTGRLVGEAEIVTPAVTPTTPHGTDSRPIRIVPKGLRSFDATDSDFFLELLPGPRDRDGMPDSLRFWKKRIEASDGDSTFSVGLIYGPSGCGKSSLMKAGLLPRLAKNIVAVYVEATGEDTETRILKGLRRYIEKLPPDYGLVESLTALRRGQYLGARQKVVLVLDQFEQWLHATPDEENLELVQALRQCDGERLQCIVMVRDDFWMAATRFMQNLEIKLVEGENSSPVDLFPLRHAEKVLAAFGRAFGDLPADPADDSKEQKQFIEQSIQGLARERKVISVRLALFAEMVKGKPWTPTTIKDLGGIGGIGVAFLEETFAASTAPPQHRLHQKAAQAVLKTLLPVVGTDIKGHMRSSDELLEASGYAGRRRDFADLLRILDSELRLITPTDTAEDDEGRRGARDTGASYYQLTHDYLVPSLREWLTRKQKESRRGRAELLLSDRADIWNSRPENRQLPSLWQWMQIRCLTSSKNWTQPQRTMMARAFRYHAFRGGLLVLVLALLGFAGREVHGRQRANDLRDRLLNANTADVPAIMGDLASYRRWVNPLLRQAYREAEERHEARKQLHASLALLPGDPGQVDYLYSRLLAAEPQEVPVISEVLMPYKDELKDRLWSIVEAPPKGQESQRLRAAAALAKFDPDNDKKWEDCGSLVVDDLVAENPIFLGQWSESFRPVKDYLIEDLSEIYRDQAVENTSERNLATSLLADYAADNRDALIDLLMDANEKQFGKIFPKFKEKGGLLAPFKNEIDKKVSADLPFSHEDRERLAIRQANSGAVLLKMNQPDNVWTLLKYSTDPRTRSYLIHRLVSLGVDANLVAKRLEEEKDVTIRRALILCLGEYGESEIAPLKQAWLPRLEAMMSAEDDPGIHGAIEWTLRQWKQQPWLKQFRDRMAGDKAQREERLGRIQSMLGQKDRSPQWYINSQGQTLVVLPGPIEFKMGSPPDEEGRQTNERQHTRRIVHSFAISTTLVTVEQFKQFDKKYEVPESFARQENMPAGSVDWYMAARYCNWLSKQEGFPESQWVYEIKKNEVRLKKNYLSLQGYRLAQEAELEYATRSGSLTSRYFGETDTLLPKYAWFLKNAQDKVWPVGSLKPNDFGLFDTMGNVYTWCQESFKLYPSKEEIIVDSEDDPEVPSTRSRVIRGISGDLPANLMRSAFRDQELPIDREGTLGLRIVRTILPENGAGSGK